MTTVTATTAVYLPVFGHSNIGNEEYRDWEAYRPSSAAADQSFFITTIGTTLGTANLDGTTADTTIKAFEFLAPLVNVHQKRMSDLLNEAIAIAQQKQYISTNVMLTRGLNHAGVNPDLDMEASGVTQWTAGNASSATATKVTASSSVGSIAGPGLIYSGTQALEVALSGASGYQRSTTLRVDPSVGSIYTAIVARANVGTVTLKLWDNSNSAYINTGADVSYAGGQWAVLERTDAVPAGCYEVKVEIRGTGASDVLFVDSVYGPWQGGIAQAYLPSWLNESYKVRYIRPSRFDLSLGTATYDAFSRRFTGDYQQPQDFFVEAFYREANPNVLNLVSDELRNGLTSRIHWLVAQRSLADVEPLTTEAGTTNQPLEETMAFVMYQIASSLADLNPDNAEYKAKMQQWKVAEAVETLGRPSPPMVSPRGMVNRRA